MAGHRYIVPVFNRLAAAAQLRAFILTLVVLNYYLFFLEPDKLRFGLVLFPSAATDATHSNELRPFLATIVCTESPRANRNRYLRRVRAFFLSCFQLCPP